ncbi:hypothetical protein [Xenorhabdus bovienii]|uniref:hypothetical protein n=1 Tax=Xenorhabdus bovienii TaxID=40576 RepID=UPI0023B29201|nr:hypothetical protein [Xenorhabdus bovienii]
MFTALGDVHRRTCCRFSFNNDVTRATVQHPVRRAEAVYEVRDGRTGRRDGIAGQIG